MRRINLAVLLIGVSIGPSLEAQSRGIVTGAVRATSDSLPGAHVHATAPGVDTTVRVDARGLYTLVLPYGRAHLRVAMIGYEPLDRDIAVDAAESRVDLTMSALPHQLATLNVRETWIGIHGVIGDSSTMQPLAGVRVTSLRRRKSVVTDSAGRFDIPLSQAEQTMLDLRRDGYQSRAANVVMNKGSAADVVLFMSAGKDPNYLKAALVDLDHRAAWSSQNSFIASRAEFDATNAPNLLDALTTSPLMTRKGFIPTRYMCLMVDGVPRPGMPLSSVRMADVDFVEVYTDSGDEIGSLSSRFSKKIECAYNDVPKHSAVMGTGVKYVAVWTRK